MRPRSDRDAMHRARPANHTLIEQSPNLTRRKARNLCQNLFGMGAKCGRGHRHLARVACKGEG